MTPTLSVSGLHPYGTFVVLRYTGTDLTRPLPLLLKHLKDRLPRARSETEIVREGLDLTAGELLVHGHDDRLFQEGTALVVRRSSPPPWGRGGSDLVETRLDLSLILRRADYIVIHCDSNTRDALLKWVRSKAQPPFQTIPKKFLHAAFVRGETRDIWMAGTHPRSRSKPDAKNMSGLSVQEALTIQGDSTFSMKAARSELPTDSSITAISGPVGTSPGKSLVWNRQVGTFNEFVAIAGEALDLIEAAAAGTGIDRPFNLLAAEVDDLSSAQGAYDMVISTELFDPTAALSQDQKDAAVVLEPFSFQTRPTATPGPEFDVDVLHAGSMVGSLRGRPTQTKHHIDIEFVTGPSPSDPVRLADARNALSTISDDLSVYYNTGHCLQRGSLYLEPIQPASFPRWRWQDFAGYDVHIEKPAWDHVAIHQQVGLSGDRSLFGWVVSNYGSGWLTCDDGAGEVADFVQLDGILRLIHVKAAESDSTARLVSTGAYELVASQATKNIGFLNVASLADRLESTSTGKAAWLAGVRQTDRQGLIALLRQAPANLPTEVVIVQPHLRQSHYQNLKSATVQSEDKTRLHRLEFLLNGSRTVVASVGSELIVVAST